MKAIYYKLLSFAALTAVLSACERDMQAEINDGKWNHEHRIVDIKLENQVGVAAIENIDTKSGIIDLAVNIDAVPDISSVKIVSLQLSYQAKSSLGVGDCLNFDNAERVASIAVTAVTGETRDYLIRVKEFAETITGQWAVTGLYLFGGTGPEWGGGEVLALSDKSWCWNNGTGPSAENDNTIVFTLDGVTDDGNTYGTCVHEPGPDGKYFDCIFVGNNPETGQNVDLSSFYRQVPKGTSSWKRDYSAGTVTFTDADGNITTGSFVDTGTEEHFIYTDGDKPYDLSFRVENNALAFSLSGTDDWNNIYSDYDKFVKKPRKLWVTIKKK